MHLSKNYDKTKVTICQRSIEPSYIVSCYINWVTTSRTCSGSVLWYTVCPLSLVHFDIASMLWKIDNLDIQYLITSDREPHKINLSFKKQRILPIYISIKGRVKV